MRGLFAFASILALFLAPMCSTYSCVASTLVSGAPAPAGETGITPEGAGIEASTHTAVTETSEDSPEEGRTDEQLFFMELPMVFAAAKFEQLSSEAPASVEIITAEEIERCGFRTLDAALRSVTGFYTTYDRNYTYVGVRGYYLPGDFNSRILVLVDGISYNGDVYGGGGAGTAFGIDMDNVKRIEIVKGPGSALYGTNALFAVINVVTKDPKAQPGVKASVEYGSYDSRKTFLSYRHSSGDLSFAVSGSYTDTEGQDLYFPEYDGYVDEGEITHDGIFRDADWDRAASVHGKLAYKQLSFAAAFTSRDKGIPTGAYWTVFNDNRTKNIDETTIMELKYTAVLDPTKSLLTRLYLNNYRFRGDWLMWYEDTDGYYQELGKDLATSRRLGSEVQLNLVTSVQNRLILGGEFQFQDILQRYWDEGLLGEEYYCEYLNDERDLNVWSVYTQDIYKLSTMSFILGARHDHYSTFGGTTNPRLGLIYTPTERTNIKLLYGSAFRAPSPYELYYNDGYYSITPNEDLKPEKLRTTEVAVEQKLTPAATAKIAVYRTDLSNLVYQVATEEIGMGGDPLLQFQNIGKANATGVELTLTAAFRAIRTRLGYAYQQTRDINTDDELVNSPRNLGKLCLSIPVFSNKNYITTEMHYVGQRLTVADEWLDDYLCTNFILYLKEPIPRVDFTARLNNAFDVAYDDPCSTEHLQSRMRQDERNFVLKLTYKL